MCVEIRTGIDIVKVSRMQASIEKQGERFLNRIFTDREIAYCEKKARKYESYAARFAAKEACIKAFGARETSLRYQDIEVCNAPSGMPSLIIHADISGITSCKNISVSLSHEEEYAVAVVVIGS